MILIVAIHTFYVDNIKQHRADSRNWLLSINLKVDKNVATLLMNETLAISKEYSFVKHGRIDLV